MTNPRLNASIHFCTFGRVVIEAKKDKELFYVKLFKDRCDMFPEGEIISSETPDFLVRSESWCVGIEVREVFRTVRHRGHPVQKRESELHRIMQKARQLYEGQGLPPVMVRAFFSDDAFTRADLNPTAERLARIVTRMLPEGEGQRVEDYDWCNRHEFGDRIHKVTVNRQAWITDNQWSAPEAMWIPEEGPELLQGVLDAKEPKYKPCRSNCDEVWLLIVSGATGLSSMIRLKPEALQHEYATSFDRVFLFEDGREVTPLKARPVSGS